jgi:O-antigen ligase
MIWATHPNQLGEVSGLLFLLALLFPIRSRWYTQLFLLGINVLAGEKTATAALFITASLMLLVQSSAGRLRLAIPATILLVAGPILVLGSVGILSRSPAGTIGRATESIYGTQVSNEVDGLDGRFDVWKRGLDLAQDCSLLGFGFDGSREYLMRGVAWSGHAHNGFLQSMLSAGIPGVLALCIGLALALAGSITGSNEWNVKLIALSLYLLALAMISPIFDGTSYFCEVLCVLVLYVPLKQCMLKAQSCTPQLQQQKRVIHEVSRANSPLL